MTNYVIINGVNSNTINGLGINELPPITKPLQRSLIEEIDGRDGDIITKLGYGAYDKTMTIGLFHTYDIDEVIVFFNGEGTITFSNEPDKVYYFTILDQIDYEKLINFKTATITLHCQPFKYPIEETPIEVAYQYVEGEGETLTLENTAEAQMQLDLLGNTQQDSTSISGGDEYDSPSPDHPQPIHTCSGDNTIKVEGKNLFDKDNANTIAGYIDTGNVIRAYATNYLIYLKVQSNTTYTLKKNVHTSGGITIGYTQATPTIGGSVTNKTAFANTNIATFTTPNDITYLVAFIYNDYDKNAGKTLQQVLDGIQIEKGSTATPYTQYTSQSHLISLGDIELNKIGTYQDKIYKDNGKWYLHKEIGKITFNGSEDGWSGATFGNYYRCSFAVSGIITGLTVNDIDLFSNYFYGNNNALNSSNAQIGMMAHYRENNNVYFVTEETSVANFKTWLSTHNTSFYYRLATPTNTEITDSTLLETLENIYSMTGTTNITQENNDLPFTINAKALMLGSGTATINNIGNVYSKPTLDIVGNGVVNVSLNGNQIFSVNVSDEIIIDSTNLEAYNPTTHELMNRQVTGNIANLKLDPGENTLTISGDLDTATITNYVRWL